MIKKYINFKKGTIHILKFVNDTIIYKEDPDSNPAFETRASLTEYINNLKDIINNFLKNTNHPLYSEWNNYYNYLSSLNVNEIMPDITVTENGTSIIKEQRLPMSLEEYIINKGDQAYHIIELPA